MAVQGGLERTRWVLGTPPPLVSPESYSWGTECGVGWRAGSVCAPETFSHRRQGLTECPPGWQGNKGDIDSRSAKIFTRVGRKRGAVSPPSREVGQVAVNRKPKEPLDPIMIFLVLEDEAQRWEIDLGGSFQCSDGLLPVWISK